MGVLASFALGLTLLTDPTIPLAAPCTCTVSIRLQDYAGVSDAELLATERQVSAIYEAIGVKLAWRISARPEAVHHGRAEWPSDPPAELTVIVVTSRMAEALGVPGEVVGYAAVSRDSGGHLVFVVGDRTHQVAAAGRVSYPRVLASVIAHELAHLFMPRRPHTREGMMRPDWSPNEFRASPQQSFSIEEAEDIRRTVSRLSGGTRQSDH